MLRQLAIINQIIGKKMEKKIPVVTLMHYINHAHCIDIFLLKKTFSLIAPSFLIYSA